MLAVNLVRQVGRMENQTVPYILLVGLHSCFCHLECNWVFFLGNRTNKYFG
jgi:hypothetical protein